MLTGSTVSEEDRATTPQSVRRAAAGYVLHEKSRQHHWEGVGLLSVKSFHSGQSLYDVGCGRYAVDDSSYLVLNDQQPYAITVEADAPVESFCVFFRQGLAEEVSYSLSTTINRQLDGPERANSSPVNFFERTYPHDDILSPALFALRASFPHRKDDQVWLAEQLHALVQRLLEAHREASEEVNALPAARVATREELYRRLHRARDFIAASFDQPISLDDMARVACLSSNHFLRTFKQVFHQSPHQYLTSLRLERAQRMLARTELSVTEIGQAVGFESLGSFSWLFRRRTGLSPDAYRRRKR